MKMTNLNIKTILRKNTLTLALPPKVIKNLKLTVTKMVIHYNNFNFNDYSDIQLLTYVSSLLNVNSISDLKNNYPYLKTINFKTAFPSKVIREIVINPNKNIITLYRNSRKSRNPVPILSLDCNTNSLYLKQQEIPLGSRTGHIIRYLIQNVNTYLDRKALITCIYGEDGYFNQRSFEVYMKKIIKLFIDSNDVEIINDWDQGIKMSIPNCVNNKLINK